MRNNDRAVAVRRSGKPVALVLAAATTAALLTGCDADDAVPSAGGAETGSTPSSSPSAVKDPVAVTVNVTKGERDVPVSRRVQVRADAGRLDHVAVTAGEVALSGALSPDGTTWTADDLLEPDTLYTVRATAAGEQGGTTQRQVRFRTQSLSLDQQTYPSVAPLDGETVGVGMPVVVTFDVPVTNKKAFERHMKVATQPAQQGSWHWLSDHEAHWRPATYWQAGTDVTVEVGVNSVPAGNGVFGQEDRTVHFHVGDTHVYRVNTQTDQMKVFVNKKLVRTLPVTTGKAGFTTRSGTKVIIEKSASKRMRSETIGIGKNNPEYYDLDDVQWAMRLTYSGEFIHAAPWSVGSQGRANVSHGCTGLSTANAKWLYDLSRRGDVVEYTGTSRPMEFGNGYGDWNESFGDYQEGSAL
ncbi:Lipoprotein-anchoring transpeptidase ErfK/SrfK [Nocardioides terrae]|uniref:Lipoprotein-anchoring transpeptidase ErfK/SrfK n=1 Tax=Nocardioides terrae TaxID=574651 RepID=A0A1I1G6H8_9ACTN|nr:Ig-like domain-containing protein [Nocardioides terrae]SFC06936.1 Lipoprotein-anchoring transpeptidase ErfK/SrfK [Nocardioides terrae]